MTKKTVKVEIREFDPYKIEGDLISVIGYLQSFLDDSEYDKVEIETDYTSEGAIVYLYGYRLETDKEYEKRLKREEKIRIQDEKVKKQLEERDRKEYERLKKKFKE